ncbi:efflux RND transporter permease subunit [Sulfurimonas sp. MAG313]|nr:efflux RND transporter permease subunit [Sulfurimonas sp. MAG313]MDF1881033.1 efflux RND transporter permease subunit [Sulfurimonas sp. MAG313]
MLRKFIEFAIDKPLLNHIFLAFILVLSVMAYINIPKEIFPPIQMDKVVITGAYPGTSADVMDKMAVKNIEDELKNINAIDSLETEVKNGSFKITAEIKNDAENISALNDVKDVIAKTKRDLPSDMDEPIARLFEESIPLTQIAISGDFSTKELLKMAKILKSDLSLYQDLNEVTVRGDADEELLIKLNLAKIEAFDLVSTDVIQALSSMSSIFPIGTLKEKGRHLFISTNNGEKELSKLQDTLLNVGGKRVRLGDIAEVEFTISEARELSHYNGLPSISINITKSKSGNAIALVKDFRILLKKYEETYPAFHFNIYGDTSVWIKNRLNTVFSNIMFGLFLVFIAMMITVNRGIAFVVALGIPLSFMIGLIVTEKIGYSLNMLSLLGGLIALGMLVDEAIVVAENIYRHLELGKSRREAVVEGTIEMFPAVLAATLTTVFAFLPLLMMTGEMGAFIRILPIMISVLLISSLFEAFYFLPLHAKDFLRIRHEDHVSHDWWEKMYNSYEKTLRFLLKRKKSALGLMMVSILSLTFILGSVTRFQLFPDFDVTQVFVTGKLEINHELKDTEAAISEIEKKILEYKKEGEMISISSIVGMRLDAKNHAIVGENLFHIFIDLNERAPSNFFEKYINPYISVEYDADLLTRKRTARDIQEDIKKIIEPYIDRKENGIKIFEEISVIVPGTGVVKNDVEISLYGKEDKVLIEGLKRIEDVLRKSEGVFNISNDATEGQKELKLRINAYGQQLGFNEEVLNKQLRALYLQGEYGKMFNEEGLVRIKVESLKKDNYDNLYNLELDVPGTHQKVRLDEVADFILLKAYVSIGKQDGKRIRSIFASLNKEKITAGEMTDLLEPILKELKEEDYGIDVKGEEEENQKTINELSQAFLIAVFLIFITLVWLFDSLVNSAIVLSNVLFIGLGVLAGHFIMGINMTMPSMIGAIGLVGVVVNDGILMVLFIRKANDIDELVQLARTRLRPIVLTSITTVLGLSTLIFFASGQAMILQPMAISLGFGIAWATVLNLLYIPLLYSVVKRVEIKS